MFEKLKKSQSFRPIVVSLASVTFFLGLSDLRALFLFSHLVQEPVGVFESQRYMDVENSLARESTEHIHQQLHLLAHSSIPLVSAVNDALRHASEWSKRINGDRSYFSGRGKRGEEYERGNEKVVRRLEREIEEYRERGRLEVLDPYKVGPR